MAAKLECEICGGKLIGKPGGVFECENCGTEYSTEWAKAKIQEITGTVKVEGTVEVTGSVQVKNDTDALLQSGFIALEDENWERAQSYFNDVIKAEPKNGKAYLGLFMVSRKFKTVSDVPGKLNPNNYGNKDLARAVQFFSEQEDPEFANIIAAYQKCKALEEKRRLEWDEKERQKAEQKAIEEAARREKKEENKKELVKRQKQCQILKKILHKGLSMSLNVNNFVAANTDGTIIPLYKVKKSFKVVPYVPVPQQKDRWEWNDQFLGTFRFIKTGDFVKIESGVYNRGSVRDISGFLNRVKEKNVIKFFLTGHRLYALADDGDLVCTDYLHAHSNVVEAFPYGDGDCIYLNVDGKIGVGYQSSNTKKMEETVRQWKDIAYFSFDGTVSAIDRNGRAYYCNWEGNLLEECDVKLFDNIDTLLEERKNALENRRETVKVEREELMKEMATVKGLFAGRTRTEIQRKIDRIDATLESIDALENNIEYWQVVQDDAQ